ncbi:MAG TPA: DUF5665 domain-containing protein [Candidatus Saccharimonadales bacterium]|nr:DUF5665 domain-containing protein [Candidatus Saccharimonadales bacterium]
MEKQQKIALKNRSKEEYEQMGRALNALLQSEYLERRQAYKSKFLLGIVGGIGGVIGATVVITVIILLLSIFKNIDPLKPFIEETTKTIQRR